MKCHISWTENKDAMASTRRQGGQIWHPNWVRLAHKWDKSWTFKISFSTVWLGEKFFHLHHFCIQLNAEHLYCRFYPLHIYFLKVCFLNFVEWFRFSLVFFIQKDFEWRWLSRLSITAISNLAIKLWQIDPKWDKSGTFKDQFQYILARWAKMYWNWS